MTDGVLILELELELEWEECNLLALLGSKWTDL